jgi:hypothetical protein
MSTETYERPKKTGMRLKLAILVMIIAGSLAASSAYSQVHVSVGLYERDYPGYTYYTYPSWHRHYRDRPYYDHYHARFEREHNAYLNGRNFDHERYERENHWHGDRARKDRH